MIKNTKLWRGLSGVLVALSAFLIFGSVVLTGYASVINSTFGIKTSVVVSTDVGQIDTEYYKSDFGEINATNLQTLEDAACAQAVSEAEEGAVLLKNALKGGTPTLPLASTERKVSLFGRATYAPLYRTNAACTRVVDNNPERVITLERALKNDGFSVNQALSDAYKTGTGKLRLGYAYGFEEPLSFYEGQQSTLADYKDVAIVMFERSAGEGTDMAVDQAKLATGATNGDFKAGEVNNSLSLQTREKDLLKFVKAQGFGKVIVLINTNYQMELGWLDEEEYGVDAALFVGTVGLTGFEGIVNILKGDVNPSGKLVDTFASNSLSSPAIVNACGNISLWANANDYRSDGTVKDVKAQTGYVSVQQENIYVGYKYYETRYADAKSGDSGAQSNVGASFDGGWDYAKEICFPFGYGKSYTTFEQKITDVITNDDQTYTVKVEVKNTGAVKGKSVVQVYASTPYGAYEKTNKIEKSAIQLVGFGKTGAIEAGASETVEVEVEKYLFASYDHTTTKGYVLTEGDYYFAIGADSHDALNNVLTEKGVSGLVDENGNAFVAPTGKSVHKFHLDLDTTTFKYGEGDATTRIEVTNQFDKMDLNYWEGNSVKYLTRSDWSGTFPTEQAKAYCIDAEMKKLLQGEFYEKPSDAPSTDKYAQGKKNNFEGEFAGLSFVSMKDIAYEDDEVWDLFLDQLSVDELASLTANYFGNKPIEKVTLPEMGGGDGCQGVGDEPYDESLTGGAVLWPCLYTSLLACTYNKDLMINRGKMMANQALFLKQTVIWTGGGNLHRTPYGGRQAEYYSEDANLCYMIGSIELPEMEKRGILGGIKHFCANDQETQREGLNTFYLEQAHREGSLRGFEGAVKKGKVNAIMQSFNRQGVVYSSSCYELNVTVLRKEWGFKGEAITDASSGVTSGYKSHYTTSMTHGTDIYCLDGEGKGGSIIAKSIKDNDDGYLLGWLRTAAKHTVYALSRSAAVNGLSANSKVEMVMPAWQILMYVAVGVISAIAVASCVMLVLSTLKSKEGV